MIDDFDFKENYCMVFEKLGVSLYDVLVKNEFQGKFLYLLYFIKIKDYQLIY